MEKITILIHDIANKLGYILLKKGIIDSKTLVKAVLPEEMKIFIPTVMANRKEILHRYLFRISNMIMIYLSGSSKSLCFQNF